MVNCSIKGCKSRTERKETNISFHTFPKEPFLKNKWTECTGRSNWNPAKSSRICSKHFESSFFRHEKTRTVLNLRAVPTLFIHGQRPLSSPVPCSSKCDNSGMDRIPKGSLFDTSPTTASEDISMEKNSGSNMIPPKVSARSAINVELNPRKARLLKKLKSTTLVSEQRKRKLAALRSRARRLKKNLPNYLL